MARTEEQEQEAEVSPDFPYKKFMRHPAWPVLERAIEELVENADLDLQTATRYVIGSLLGSLFREGLLRPVPSAKQRKELERVAKVFQNRHALRAPGYIPPGTRAKPRAGQKNKA